MFLPCFGFWLKLICRLLQDGSGRAVRDCQRGRVRLRGQHAGGRRHRSHSLRLHPQVHLVQVQGLQPETAHQEGKTLNITHQRGQRGSVTSGAAMRDGLCPPDKEQCVFSQPLRDMEQLAQLFCKRLIVLTLHLLLLPGCRSTSTGSAGRRTPSSGSPTCCRCWRRRCGSEACPTSSPTNSTWPSGTKATYVRESVLSSDSPLRDNFSFLKLWLFLHQATHVRVHSDEDTDVVTGLKQKTHYGRPAWDKEFEQVRKENPT